MDEPPARDGLSWLPYRLSNKIWANNGNPIHLDLSDYRIDKRFWLKLSPADCGLSKQLRTYGFREPLNCQCYVKFVEDTDTLLDVGANIGFFTLLGSNAKRIICVEPLSDAIALLRENIELNGMTDKCEVVQAALGPTGVLHLEINPQMNLSRIVEEKSGNTIEVRSIPLSSMAQKYSPNLIRLDVEGFEFDILHDEVPDSVDKISMEFHSTLMGEKRSTRLLAYFRDAGFRVRYFVEDLPLRFYPLLRIVKNTDFFKPMCYIWSDVDYEKVNRRIFSGRALKYLYLQR